jgi:flagellar hook-associated protein 2
MSLNDVRAAINAVSSTTGVTASVVNVSAGESRLVLSASETGREISLAGAMGDDVLAILGLSADGGATVKYSVQPAQNARVEVDGLMIERTGNRIGDALPGLMLELYRAEPGTTVTVEVGRALGGAKESIGALVGALNALRSFVERNSLVNESGRVADQSVLFGDTTLRSIANAVSAVLTNRVEGLGAGAAASLGALGISMDVTNRLVIDDARLDARLLGDLAGVRGVLEFTFTSSSPDLALFNRTGALAATAFTVDIVDADADGLPESASINGVPLALDGRTLVGPPGSAYEGLELIWSGTGSASIAVTATRGIAERLYTTLAATLDLVDGELASATGNLQALNKRHRDDIERIEARAEDYRLRLIERFAAMESALSLAKAMLQQVETTTKAMFADR